MSDFNWNYKTETGFEEIPEGDYRVMINTAEKAVSKSGNDMLVLTLYASGYKKQIKHYIVFLRDKPEITNRNLTEFFESFGIEKGNFNLGSYFGRIGAAHIHKPDEDFGEKVKYFITGKKKEELPAFSDAHKNVTFVDVSDIENPF